jgi:ABC-2 type transport system permease protein
VFVRLTFYLSPILYSVKNVPDSLHLVFYFNPTVAMFVMARSMFFPQEMRWQPVVTSACVGVVIFIIGVYVFARMERRVLKEL